MKSLSIKLLLFANYIVLILMTGKASVSLSPISIQSLIPLFLATLLMGDMTYIASCNLKGNTILFLFCGLLAADSWYLFFTAGLTDSGEGWFRLLGPAVLYLSVRFCLLFLFQGYTYKMKKAADLLLTGFFLCSEVSVFLSERIYAGAYGIQFAGSVLCFLSIVLCHRKRVWFVLKSGKRAIVLSCFATMAAFFIYYFLTLNINDHIGNFGVYIMVLIFFMSVHGIVLKETDGIPLCAVFSFRQQLFLGCAVIGGLLTVCLAFGWPASVFLLLLNLAAAFFFLCNILLGENLKTGKNRIGQESKYTYALGSLQHEEELKSSFANFLHDDVLQDLLAVKNMAPKSSRPEIQDLIMETLEQLNVRIRNQMQDCHPILLKSLTLKENLDKLIQSVQSLFPQREIQVAFTCPDTLFIPEPYDMLVYRLIKELLINVYKHSDGNRAQVTLSLERDAVKLSVGDNGTAGSMADMVKNQSPIWHKGLASMKEQIEALGGSLSVSYQEPRGVRTEIRFLVKGDVSYKHFVS